MQHKVKGSVTLQKTRNSNCTSKTGMYVYYILVLQSCTICLKITAEIYISACSFIYLEIAVLNYQMDRLGYLFPKQMF